MILQVPTATNLTHEHPGADTQIGQLAGIKNAKARLAPPPQPRRRNTLSHSLLRNVTFSDAVPTLTRAVTWRT